MEALERENAARVARGARPRPLHSSWVNRPQLRPHERALWDEFYQFATFCGGDPRPTDALAWFEMRAIPKAERPWLAELFAVLSAVVKERVKTNG